MASVVQGTSNGDYDLARGLGLYDTSGDLPARARSLWAQISDSGSDLAREFWRRYARSPEVKDQFDDAKIERLAEKILPYIAAKFERIDNPEWANQAQTYVEKALNGGLTLSTLLAGVNAETEAAFVAIRRQVRSDEEQVALARTLSEIQAIEIDCFIHHAITLTRNESSHTQARQAGEFNSKVMSVVQSCTRESDQLRAQAATTSTAARGMLGKTSEVAAAAEQSAIAMREAAQTAAGLIRAIEDARTEVEVASGVAQEVKSLASQTARATDDITAKITAITAATRQTVEANGSIQATVEEVQTSADRIRQAMELQAQTVTMITAAVDETALAADSMSSTIAAIRSDTENVAKDIDEVEQGFGRFSDQISDFKSTTKEFVAGIAA